MDYLVPEGFEVLKLLKISERGSNQLRYQNRLFGLKNPSKDLWRCKTPKCGVADQSKPWQRRTLPCVWVPIYLSNIYVEPLR